MTTGMSVNSTRKCLKYTETSTHLKAPKWSFTGPPPGTEKLEQAPGPGKYGCPSLKEKFRSTPNISFGTSVRAFEKKYNVQIGPGTYTPKDPNQTSAMYGFGTASRLPKTRPLTCPDPGAYRTAPGLATRDLTMGGKREGKGVQIAPGPGQYHNGLEKGFKALWHKDADVSFGTEKRAEPFKDLEGPPPGTYKVATDLGKDLQTSASCPNFSFYSRRRPMRADATPGPIYPHYTQFG
jgi:hypothetical protein